MHNRIENPVQTSTQFYEEYVFVILTSGWKYNLAKKYFALYMEHEDTSLIGHPKKRLAIQLAKANYTKWFFEYQSAPDKIAYIKTLPMMSGDALPYLFARNIGAGDCVKPDVWLKRMAKHYGFKTPLEMCTVIKAEIPQEPPIYFGEIDFVLWRACLLGWWKPTMDVKQ